MTIRGIIGATFVFALLARVLYVGTVSEAEALRADGAHYDQIARSLAAGRGFARPDGQSFWGEETPDKRGATVVSPPLYPLLVAGIYRVGLGYRAVLVVQALMGAVAATLIASVAYRLAGLWSALLAGALAGVSPYLVQLTGGLMTETLAVFLVVVALVAFLAELERRRPWSAAALGVVVGLGVMARPTIQILAVAFTVGWLWPGRGDRQRQLVRLGLFWGLLALTLAPWAVRNYRVMGVFLPTTTAGPYNFFKGWNPWELAMYQARTRPEHDLAWQAFWHRRAEIYAEHRDLPYWPRALAFQQEGWRFITERPGDALRLWAYKLVHYFSPGVQPLHYPRAVVVVSWIWGAILFGLASIGLWRRWDVLPEWRRAALVVILGSGLLHSLVQVELRYRIPFVEPLAIIYAAAVVGRRGAADRPG